jgi:formylglycine-generating enzyme required for sulfatase activity
MHPSFQNFIDCANELSDEFQEFRTGVLRAVHIAHEDPEMALVRTRMVLHLIVQDVFLRRVQEPPGTRPLENLIDRIVKDGHFPGRLKAFSDAIRELGNIAAHRIHERFSPTDVYRSLTLLMAILEWYFEVERPHTGIHLNIQSPFEAERLVPPEAGKQVERQAHVAVVPKGLRSFDTNDSGFFLELLPGPRDDSGLPESIRFWKHSIEATNEGTFTVGVIYGPSGCGKSSLVKAGLIPRLGRRVVSVYVEATADDTEIRLLNRLRKRFPGLSNDLDLTATITALCHPPNPNDERKILIVLDQFEQWLHAHRTHQDTDLARALRQSDGEHVQCIVMVRDDFWVSLNRFTGELGIQILEGQNAALVDLFDVDHARKVLTEFGRSHGRLSDTPAAPSPEQDIFLESAAQGLSQEGRVVPIRLAVFVEVVKGKPWTPSTLEQVGGTEGVGIAFLEETFKLAALRPHQKAGQAVLKALLPETGTDIRGRMRSYDDLIEAARWIGRSEDFGHLLRTLDREVRLITPTDPEEQVDSGDGERHGKGDKYYQLTHDYLVDSLRTWLTRKQQETRVGRAELRLAERSALWNDKPDNRLLPSALEWASIQLLTRKQGWTNGERRMMKRAGWVHGSRTLTALVLLGLLAWGSIEVYGTNRASVLVEKLAEADTAKVPAIIGQLESYRHWANPRLKAIAQSAADHSREKLHASLALLSVDASQLLFLEKRLLVAAPAELPVIRDALRPHESTLVPKLWSAFDSSTPGDASLLPAASALADYDAASPRWDSAGGKVAQALVSVNPVDLGWWVNALRPVSGKLTAPLAVIFRSKRRPETERTLAANILTDYAGEDPDLAADLLMDAEFNAFAAFFAIARKFEATTVRLFREELAKKPEYRWNKPPRNPDWAEPDPTLAAKIEAAQGMLTERFAFCQSMPLEEFLTTAEGLRKSGYRPIRFRPYADGRSLLVAAVWHRDGRRWRLAHDQTDVAIQQTDELNHKEGFVAVDVAGYLVARGNEGKPTPRFGGLWMESAGTNDEARMVTASSHTEFTKARDRYRKAGLVPQTLQIWREAGDRIGYCGVWEKTALLRTNSGSPRTGLSEARLSDLVAQEAGRLIDLGVSAALPPTSAKERRSAALQVAEARVKAKPDDPDARFDRATALFQLGENQRSLDDLNAVVEKKPQFVVAYQYRAVAHARLGHKNQATADLKRVQEGDSTESSKLYLPVVVAAELDEGTDKALEALEAVLKKRPEDSLLHYDAARASAMAAQALAGKNTDHGRQLCERALALLRTAIQNGYSNYEDMQQNTDLDPIRELPAFAEIMKAGHLDRSYSAVWSGELHFEASALAGLDTATHLKRCRELASQGYRMASLSVARTSSEGPLVAVSLWHRPVITEEAKDHVAERQARAAIALFCMEKRAEVLPIMCYSDDPRPRSFIINWLSPLGADPRAIAAELDRVAATAKPGVAAGQQLMDALLFQPETSVRRALILSLGTYGKERLFPAERESLTSKLIDLYRNDPDSGVHGAALWALQRWGQEEVLKATDTELMKLKNRGDRRWYLNSQGQTFAVIEGPVEFRMGSPPTEPDRSADHELAHHRAIPRRFAVAAKEVTVEEYQEFVKENPEVDHANNDDDSPDLKGPMNQVSWYDAVAYCNWLSRKEHLAECYEPKGQDQYTEGMTIRADALERTGYRLPTEAEWEYACRAGTGTSRYFGANPDLLGRYAWYQSNSQARAWRCGSLLPNDLGLFDMLGNVNEWCQERARGYRPDRAKPMRDILTMKDYVTKSDRVLRGAAFYYRSAEVRSAYRDWNAPDYRSSSLGFRLARTYR